MEKEQRIWRYIVENGIATEEEVELVIQINGFSEETLNDILFVRTGYRDLDQIEEEIY